MANHFAEQLRFRSAVDATQLALSRRTELAYGTSGVSDPHLRASAKKIHARLSNTLKAVNSESGT